MRHGKTKQQQQNPTIEFEVAESTAKTKWGKHPEGLCNQFISNSKGTDSYAYRDIWWKEE